MGNDIYEPHSVNEFKGIRFGQEFIIDGVKHIVYRLDDKKNKVTLLVKNSGFKYADIDDFLELVNENIK